MTANAEDPLLAAAEQILGGVPVDWKKIRTQLATPEQEAVAEELQSLERFAQVSQAVLSTWGRFTIIEEIGRGNFGTVYRAFDPDLQLEVALKIIESRETEVLLDSGKALEEARRLVRIQHTNVVRAYGAECLGTEVGLWMEFVKGRTLDDIVRLQAPFSAGEAVVIGLDLCRALASVHGAGVLHGDIKAHNVMREAGGRTVLMDFGTGRDLTRAPARPGNDFAGTPLYLAPEVFAGHNRTPGSDIYSLGVLLYFLVTGTYPVEGDSRSEIERHHDQGRARRRLRDVRPDLPEKFIQVVERATAERPEDRFESAGALEAALLHVLSQQEPVSPRPMPVLNRNAGRRDPRSRWDRMTRVAVPAGLVLLVIAGIAIGTLMLRAPAARVDDINVSEPESLVPGADQPAVPPVADDYRIDAAFYRERASGVERLHAGSSVAPSDSLSLQLQVSVPAYVYVINEDEAGESFLLFPLPWQTLPRLLPPGQRHRLPGTLDGEPIAWQVSSAGGKEHFIVVVSRERSPAFEELFATLRQPTFGPPLLNARLSDNALGVMRSVGRLAPSPAGVKRQLRQMPEFSTPLSQAEEVARGVWIRHATFDNPVRPPS